ncbi:MAG TPA: hypothetical protein VN794_06615 [Methylomirabilota bacterium]|nr:hypothetical protein [Methylomirabilota bacterium]
MLKTLAMPEKPNSAATPERRARSAFATFCRFGYRFCYHLAALLALSIPSAHAGETVLTNQPAAASIVRFEAARMPPKGALWHELPRADGEFVLSAIQGLPEWHPRWEGAAQPGCMLPPPNDFAVRAVTKQDGDFYITFTTGAELVWVGSRLLDVRSSASRQIVQRVGSALKK